MTAVRRDLVIEKGATFRFYLRLQDKAGAFLDLTGFTGRMQIRAALLEPVALDLSNRFTFDAVGRARVTASPEQTSALTITNGVYDLELQSPSGEVDRLYEGKIKVRENVTR